VKSSFYGLSKIFLKSSSFLGKTSSQNDNKRPLDIIDLFSSIFGQKEMVRNSYVQERSFFTINLILSFPFSTKIT